MKPVLRRNLSCALAMAAWIWPVPAIEAGDGSHAGTPQFQRFHYSFFEDPLSARDGLDEPALAGLDGEERAKAEKLLIDFLPDARAVIGLGVLRSTAAQTKLIALFDAEEMEVAAARRKGDLDTTPNLLAYLAKTLWLIQPAPRWADALTAILITAEDDMQRHLAAECLIAVQDARVEPALKKALDDPAELVRYAVGQALLALHGLPHDPGADNGHMLYRVMSDDAARRSAGKRDILSAIAEKPVVPGK